MLLQKLKQFLAKPTNEKICSLRYRFKCVWNFIFPFIPLLVRLPSGSWWIAVNDFNSDSIFTGDYEIGETKFVSNFLKEEMVVLDIGAHDGYYTLLASKKVGEKGKVIAFEPSPKERKLLHLNLKINMCKNVKVESYALSSQVGESTFYVVVGHDTGCNSLKLPRVSEPTKEIKVSTTTLDDYLKGANINSVDFIKIDAEGAELEIFKGSKRFFEKSTHPIILCEVSDYRAQPWGYLASDIIHFLETYGYNWFGLNYKGQIVKREESETYNLVAIPKSKISSDLINKLKYG